MYKSFWTHILVISLISLDLFMPGVSSAQTAQSKCVVTKVGNPAAGPTLPAQCSTTPGGVLPPDYPADLRKAIIDKFGVTMDGYDPTHLKWAWEKFWDVSNTKFPNLVRGAFLKAVPKDNGAKQWGCGGPVSVTLPAYNVEASFKFLVTHELGHYIQNCNLSGVTHVSDIENAFYSSQEGPISYYAGHTAQCNAGKNATHEDYADTVAYFLNPKAGLVSAGKGLCPDIPTETPPNPFFELQPRKELHYAAIVQVLQ